MLGSLWDGEARRWPPPWDPRRRPIAPHVKGLEIPGYDPRAAQAMALGFAVGTRGADHNRSGAYQVDFSDRIDRYHLQPQQVQLAIETEDQPPSSIVSFFASSSVESSPISTKKLLSICSQLRGGA